jgi:hypothetical protein
MEVFGHAERVAVRLYPYRLPLGALLLVAVLALLWLGWRRGWGPLLWRRRVAVVLVAAPLLAVVLPVGYYTLSPLWTRTTLYEESPLLAEAADGQPPAAASASAPATRPVVTATTSPAAAVTRAPSTPTPHATPSPLPTTTPPTPEAPPTSTATVEPTAIPEPTPAPFEPRLLASGTLSGADDFHFAEGATLLIESEPGRYVLRLENVSVRNGPDLFVYLSPSADGLVDGAINLGGLKATDGSFNYAIPDGVDVGQFAGVVIWCRQFAVLFATAPF